MHLPSFQQQPVYEQVSQEPDEAKLPSSSALPIRPPTYYGEGPFDPPSSEDEDEGLLEKSNAQPPENSGLEGGGSGLRVGAHKRTSSLRYLVISLASLVVLSAFIGIFGAVTYKGAVYHAPGAKHLTMDHVFNGTFFAEQKSLHWVPEAGDGVFSFQSDGWIKLVDLKTNTTTNLVFQGDVKNEHGNSFYWDNWQLSPDMNYVLVKANHLKQWRHSSFGNYYIHDLHTRTTHPLLPPSFPPVTAYATWSPTGESIAYVTKNDLYVLTDPSPDVTPLRLTTSGNASLFHGVPDWVYEEEVFSSDYTVWWSPDSAKLAFLTLDETAVDEFTFPVYNPTENNYEVVPYTKDVVMKYPKPGYANPVVGVYVFDLGQHVASQTSPLQTLELTWEGRHAKEDSIIQEVAWVGNESLILKEVNRNADIGSVVFFDLNGRHDDLVRSTGRVVRHLGKDGEEGDEGWIDHMQSIYPLPPSLLPDGEPAYLDIVPSKDGYDHIALFSPATSSTPRFLTSGDWEVTGGIGSVDVQHGLVYFQAAHPSSIERHIYSVPIPTMAAAETVEPTSLTDDSTPSWYTAEFSPNAGFYLLSYHGPSVPWQKVVRVNDTSFDFVLTNNLRLNETIMLFETPTVLHSTISNEGYEFNVKEIRPPRMDTTGRTKYPVLFRVYGGPASQLVDLKFQKEWHHYLACALGYVVVTVDGRGTGCKGRKLRNAVKDNLGFWETRDQIEAARQWADKVYVDSQRIGIWGWSYGGFMAAKVVEADAGIHSLAMSVAPVTSWRLYDSIYTERYMNLPNLNPSGYINASISNVTGFHHVDYLLAHGSADDNVHYANSAHLLDMLTRDRVRSFRFRMFTDSDHGMVRRGAFRELYEWMTEFLVEKWGKGGRKRAW